MKSHEKLTSAIYFALMVLVLSSFLSCSNESKEIAKETSNKTDNANQSIEINNKKRNYNEQLEQIENQFRKIRKAINVIQQHINTSIEIVTTIDFYLTAMKQIHLSDTGSLLEGVLAAPAPFQCPKISYSFLRENTKDISQIDFMLGSCDDPNKMQKLIHFEFSKNGETITYNFYPQILKTLSIPTLNIDVSEKTKDDQSQPVNQSDNTCKSNLADDELSSISCTNLNISILELFGKKIVINSFLYDQSKFDSFVGAGFVDNTSDTKQNFAFSINKDGTSKFDISADTNTTSQDTNTIKDGRSP